jgi:hypothetical protein
LPFALGFFGLEEVGEERETAEREKGWNVTGLRARASGRLQGRWGSIVRCYRFAGGRERTIRGVEEEMEGVDVAG